MPTLTATTEPANEPPRVLLQVDVSDVSPVPTEATITRTGPDGQQPVRSAEPVALSAGVAAVYDYEPPFGVDVTYTATADAATASTGLVNLSPDSMWLRHPSVPAVSVRLADLDLIAGTDNQRTQTARAGRFAPLGRPRRVVVSSGARSDEQLTLLVRCEGAVAIGALQSLLSDEVPILLGIPPSKGLLLPQSYVAVGDVTWQRTSTIGSDHETVATLPCEVVDRPVGAVASLWTWGDVAATYATWGDVADAYTTWGDVVLDNRSA